jgi:hypothetical protein
MTPTRRAAILAALARLDPDVPLSGRTPRHWGEGVLSEQQVREDVEVATPRELMEMLGEVVADENDRLRCVVRGDRLVISVGIATLASASSEPVGDHFGGDLVVEDQQTFATEIARQLSHEKEDGTTPVHLMLDAAIIAAVEDGCDGVDYDQLGI